MEDWIIPNLTFSLDSYRYQLCKLIITQLCSEHGATVLRTKGNFILPIQRVEPNGEDETDDDDLLGLDNLTLPVLAILTQSAVLLFHVKRQSQVLLSPDKIYSITFLSCGL